MKKLFRYNELSKKKCEWKGCDKFLKKNLLAKRPHARFCYKHHKIKEAK
jgi:hypothetical protein